MSDKANPTDGQAATGGKPKWDDVLELIASLSARKDVRESGMAVLRRAFPEAPEETLSTAAFHLYTELPSALIELLGEIELSLRDPSKQVGPGAVWHVLYHLYNWMQLTALLPWTRSDITSEIREVIKAVDASDSAFVLQTLQKLLRQLEGAATPPVIDNE